MLETGVCVCVGGGGGLLTEDVFPKFVVATEAPAIELVQRAELTQRVQRRHPCQDQKDDSPRPGQILQSDEST